MKLKQKVGLTNESSISRSMATIGVWVGCLGISFFGGEPVLSGLALLAGYHATKRIWWQDSWSEGDGWDYDE